MRNHYKTVRLSTIKKTDNIKCGQGCETLELSYTTGAWYTTLERWKYLLNLKIYMLYVYSTLVIYLEEIYIYFCYIYSHAHKKTCTRIFRTAIYVITKHWKQLKYPFTIDEQINSYIHTMEHYTAVKIAVKKTRPLGSGIVKDSFVKPSLIRMLNDPSGSASNAWPLLVFSPLLRTILCILMGQVS